MEEYSKSSKGKNQKKPVAKPTDVCGRNWVAEANSLIEMPYRLELNEQKLVLTLASKIHPEDIEFECYSFKVAELAQLFGIDVQGAYKEIKKSILGILSKPLKIVRASARGSKRELLINWFSSAEYIEDEGRIELQFSPKMKPYLLELQERYTSFQLGNIVKMKSVYAIRIYMICQEILMNKSQVEEEFDIDYLKHILQIADKYEKYIDFKRYVLEQAKREIGEKSNIEFDYDPIKKGKKVVAVVFKVKRKKAVLQKGLPAAQPNDRQEIIQQLIGMGVDEDIIPDLIAGKDDEFIVENIELVKSRYSSGKVNSNLAGYLVKALKNDYRPKKSPLEMAEEERRNKAKDENEEEVKAILARYEQENSELLEQRGQDEAECISEGQGSLFDFIDYTNKEIAVGQADNLEGSRIGVEIEKELDRLVSAIQERGKEGWPQEEIEVLKIGQLDILKKRYPSQANQIYTLWEKRLGEVG